MSAFQRYVLAGVSVGIALAVAVILQSYNFRDVALPLLLFAVAASAWYLGKGPAALSIVVSTLGFNYFFTEPLYSFQVAPSDLPYFLVFVSFALLITGFSAVRRRVENQLIQARDALQVEVAERTRREEEVRRLNDELAKRSTELEGTNKELEAFAYSVSHDLRAPLRHMAGYTELLKKATAAVADAKCERYIQILLDSAARMGALIDDLLAFSRIGRAEARMTTVSLDQLVQEAVAEARRGAERRIIDWNIGSLPEVHGDRSMLRLAFVNLLSNAVKFTRTRPRAVIEVGSANGRPGETVIFVRDNGVGFDMKYANKLFGVFQRLHQPEAFEGTGIGLATVQRIVHRHGGRVWAEGQVDAGAAFYFSTQAKESL